MLYLNITYNIINMLTYYKLTDFIKRFMKLISLCVINCLDDIITIALSSPEEILDRCFSDCHVFQSFIVKEIGLREREAKT